MTFYFKIYFKKFLLNTFPVPGRHMRTHSYIIVWDYNGVEWHPTPVLLPGKSHGWRSLIGWKMGMLYINCVICVLINQVLVYQLFLSTMDRS